MKKPSIFIVVNSFGRGGAEMSLAILANELVLNNYDVFYIALWDEKIKYDFNWLKLNSVNVITLSSSKNIFKILINYYKLFRIYKPFFIYSAMLKSDIISRIFSFIFKVPHAVSIRNNPVSYYKKNSFKYIFFFIQAFFQKNIIFLSNKALTDFKNSRLSRYNNSKHFVLHNPIINEEEITKEKLREKLQSLVSKANNLLQNNNAFFNLSIVSRLVEGKGIFEILTYLKSDLLSQKFFLKIYGEGPLRENIMQYILENNLANNVKLCGFYSNKIEIFNNTDILIFGSNSEGFGRVPFEALRFGNMVICNNKSSIIHEFIDLPFLWSTYDSHFNITNYITGLAKLDIENTLNKLDNLFLSLSPQRNCKNFITIMNNCINEKL